MKNYILLSALLAVGSQGLMAQTQTQATLTTDSSSTVGVSDSLTSANEPMVPVDGFYNYTILDNASPFNYPQINPSNVRFYKRIWRDIDLTDPKNQVLAVPGSTLIETILDGLKTGKLTAYDPGDDSFKTRVSAQQVMSKLVDTVLIPVFDNNGNQIDSKKQLNDFDPQRITKFRIKEDIFFDKQRSKIESRIIGIAPLMSLNTDQAIVGEAPAFWLYFPECRRVFVKKDVSDPDKNMFDMSMDDIFLQRKFASKIIKESNTTGQRIVDYTKDSSEQEKEAMRIEAGIEEYKKKVWGYNNN